MRGPDFVPYTLALSLAGCTPAPPTRTPGPGSDGEGGGNVDRPAPPVPPEASHVRELRAAIVMEWELSLPPGEVVFETRALSPATAEPVLHLLDARGREVAIDRRGRNQNARIEYRVPGRDPAPGGPTPDPGRPPLPDPTPPDPSDPDRPRPQPKHVPSPRDGSGQGQARPGTTVSAEPPLPARYRLILRSGDGGLVTCSVYKDERELRKNAQVGAQGPLRFAALDKGEVLETVRLPGSSDGPHVIYILDDDGSSIEQRAAGGGIAGGARLQIEDDTRDRDVLIAVPRVEPTDRLRVVLNDAALPERDLDGDGLGAKLERDLGTCRSPSDNARGFDCARAADPRDTDGDGLRDDWEVLGRRDLEPVQPLALWGADPRHKDIFIELDFMQREPSETATTVNADYVRRFAELYQDEVRSLSPDEQSHRASSLRNPDGKPGIAVHMDIGEDPPSGAPDEEHALYGDWGGDYETVPPVDGKAADAGDVWEERMVEARHGLFHYALGYNGGGGQCAHHVPYCNFPLANVDVAAHEFAHTLGLGHSGPAHHGHADPNCKPNYPSIINYAYLEEPGVSFHDGRVRPVLDNRGVRERGAVAPANTRYFDHLEGIFRYRVDRNQGHVDWNRDGEFSLGEVRAYTNFMPGGRGCEWTRYNRTWVGEDAVTVGAPALARLDDTMLVVYATPPGALGYALSSHPFDCPEPAADGCEGASFRVMPALDEGVLDIDAAGIREDEDDTLLVVAKDREDKFLREHRYALVRPPFRKERLSARSEPRMIRTEHNEVLRASGSPALAVEPGGKRAYLVYKTRRDNELFWSARAEDGTWSGLRPVGAPAMQWRASPELMWMPRSAALEAVLPEGLYGAFADEQGRPRLWRLDPDQQTWSEVDVWEQDASGQPRRPEPIISRPALAFVPGLQTGRADRVYLVYVRASDHEARMSFTFVPESGPKLVRLGLDSRFDNSWHEAYGVDLLFDPEHDTDLRYVAALRHDRSDARNARLRFRPKADGLTSYEQVGWNDWEILGVELCRSLAPHARGGRKLACHDWRW